MPLSRSSPKYRLADNVRACRVGDQMIFLDMLRGKYIGVGGPQLSALSAAVLGTPTGRNASSTPLDPALLDDWIRRLRHHQLISTLRDGEPLREPPTLLDPISTLDTDDQDRVIGTDWRHLARLWRATAITAAWLRRRTLADIADRVAALEGRHPDCCDDRKEGAMRVAAARYMRMRPFALTSHDRCLNDSLALTYFLASQKLSPRWVIGVRTRPFGAHSWVQSGGVVLNDLPERVRAYQPILVV